MIRRFMVKAAYLFILVTIISVFLQGTDLSAGEKSTSKESIPYITYNGKACDVGDCFYVKLIGVRAIKYHISDETVATVIGKGKVRAERAGRVKLTITGENGKKYKCNITVYDRKRFRDMPTAKYTGVKLALIGYNDLITKKSFTVRPGILVDFQKILPLIGTPNGLIRLGKSNITDLLYYEDPECRLQEEVIAPLSKMIDAAYLETGLTYRIPFDGGYREYSVQKRKLRKGMEDPIVYLKDLESDDVACMPPVCSEHRTGYAIDLDSTEEGLEWLAQNAYKYGFIKRYSGDKSTYTGVRDETWHYTYVGKDIALTCHIENLCLEEYYEKYVDVEN